MNAYTDAEEKAMMNYILQNNQISRLKGDQLWKEMEQQNVVNRTWQSMKQHFRKIMIQNIRSEKYNLDQKTIDEIEVWFYNQPPAGKKYPNLMDATLSSSDSDKTP